ncbi:hypothetical protein SLI_4556 [Streptomyces lividans 1326]|uniref:Uncharacterized protein n=1 Tax=Streptomyces lividans 1326 TaxID=1200984 RepID=A0A7U9DVM5_STRLI|nr:hypothetical protein SLI_4556 [Streptomyces lividans 1326]
MPTAAASAANAASRAAVEVRTVAARRTAVRIGFFLSVGLRGTRWLPDRPRPDAEYEKSSLAGANHPAWRA